MDHYTIHKAGNTYISMYNYNDISIYMQAVAADKL